MRKIEKIFISSLIIGVLYFLYISIPPTNYVLTSSEQSFISTQQFEEFHTEYYGKVVDVKGIITDVSKEVRYINITLDSSFLFTIEIINLIKEVSINNEIVIKGRYEGYNDLFEEYSFTECIIQD